MNEDMVSVLPDGSVKNEDTLAIFQIPEYKTFLTERPDEQSIYKFDDALEDLFSAYLKGDVDLYKKAKCFQEEWCAEKEVPKESGVGVRRLYYPKDEHQFRYLNWWLSSRDESENKAETKPLQRDFVQFFTENSYENF